MPCWVHAARSFLSDVSAISRTPDFPSASKVSSIFYILISKKGIITLYLIPTALSCCHHVGAVSRQAECSKAIMAAWFTSFWDFQTAKALSLEDQGLPCPLSDHILASTVWASNVAKVESAW